MDYKVLERENENANFEVLASFRKTNFLEAINWADGYAYAYASYKHPLEKPCIQLIDGFFWYNDKFGYELKVVDGNGNIVKRENNNFGL